jgi:nucleotide-binding universal stress UspA family protein
MAGRELTGTGPVLDAGAGGGDSFRRILVPVDTAGLAAPAVAAATRLSLAVGGEMRIVHVRIYDPPARGCGRFYPESSADALAVLESAVACAWSRGAQASGEVVHAQRSRAAGAICAAAASWSADVIVLARRPRLAVARMLLGSVADQVLRRAGRPVLVVGPGGP